MIQLLYNKKNIKGSYDILNNKIFIFNYSKFFIRSNIFNKDCILDNSFEISSGLNKLEQTSVGYSIVLDKTLYKHKLYKNLKFYWYNPGINLYQNLDQYLKNINVKNYIFFTKLTKGGIECYSNGFKGILLKEQLISLIKHQKYNFTYRLSFFVNLKSTSKFFYFKTPVELTKLTSYSTEMKNLSTRDRKFEHTLNNFSIIFNFPEKKFSYENKKTNKKIRKHYFKKKV
jgi:hypothetical protein